jgi:hypothetical protein
MVSQRVVLQKLLTPLDERFEYIERIWKRWQQRDSFQKAYADGQSGLAELERLKNA